MRRILVTGGAGFIGSHFIKYMLANYPWIEIVNLDLLTYAANPDSLREIEDDPRYHFVKGDIADSAVVQKAMWGCDVVVHFAAESHVDRSIVGPQVFLQTNIEGTYVLLDAARHQGVERFLHFSTDEVFGALPLGTTDKFTLEPPYDPRSPYLASKAAADHLVRAYYHTYGLPVIIINCSNNFGPYQHPEKFIPRAITNVLWGKPIPIYGDGLYVRDWLYVLDNVRAIELVLKKGQVGETYIVGGMVRRGSPQVTKDIPNIRIAQRIIEILGKGEIEYIRDRPGHDRRYAVDWSKIHDELGWQPQYSFEEWLGMTVRWYQENEDWWAPLKEEAERFYARKV